MRPMADNPSSGPVELGKQTLHVTTVISVVIPMFNAEKTILPAIKSVLKQTFIDYEIIVVDDCSTDRSWNQVQALQDPRIRPFRAARNSGAAAARNLGMRHAQGEWIVFLDADDQWDPRHLEVMMSCSNDNVFVAPSKLSCVPDANGWLRPLGVPAELGQEKVKALNRSSFAEALTREYFFTKRAFLEEHHITFLETGGRGDCGGDWMYYVSKLLLAGANGCLALEPTYLYRVTGYHTSSSFEAIAQELKVVDLLSKEKGVPPEVRDSLAQSIPRFRRRLNAAALRSRKWDQFFILLGGNPSNIIYVALAGMGFISRKLRHLLGRSGVRIANDQ